MNGDRIEIFTSQKKLVKLIFYAICLIMMGIFVMTISEKQQMVSPVFSKIVGYVSLALFIPALIYILYKFSGNSPALILDSTGLTDNSSATSPGFIPWHEIEKFEVKSIYSTSLLGVVLKNNHSFTRSPNSFSRFLNILNSSMFTSSYMISTNSLDIDFEELVHLTRLYHQKYSG